MSTITKLKAMADSLGAEVDEHNAGDSRLVDVFSPPGKRWACSSVHSIALEWRRGDNAYRATEIREAIERMSAGLEDCPDPECEHCDESVSHFRFSGKHRPAKGTTCPAP